MAKPKRRIADDLAAATELRIVGGKFRGRKLKYEPHLAGDELVTRPMKHRVRESIFNLVGTEVEGLHALDLFAGTGALGLEALSRGATYGTFIERHVPTARVIVENIKSLGVADRTALLTTSAFLWSKRELRDAEGGVRYAQSRTPLSDHSAFSIQHSALPWLVFCSPPFDFFVDRQADMLALIVDVMKFAPVGSIIIVEADERFDFALLPGGVKEAAPEGQWDVRTYFPAVVGVWRKKTGAAEIARETRE